MGLGDNLLATGMARGAVVRGKRIAFGNGQKIIWDHHSEQVFRNNPNIAPLGSEQDSDLEWINFYRGNRIYNRQDGSRWLWNYDFKATPGELFFDEEELAFANSIEQGFILIEPNVPLQKHHASNKQWSQINYSKLTRQLVNEGHEVKQFVYPGSFPLPLAKAIKAPSFRHACAALSRAKLYIGPEGGLHHGAAAVGISAVVIFGGFIPPQVTGYATHTNISVGKACGSLVPCAHCKTAMESISIGQVYQAVQDKFKTKMKEPTLA